MPGWLEVLTVLVAWLVAGIVGWAILMLFHPHFEARGARDRARRREAGLTRVH